MMGFSANRSAWTEPVQEGIDKAAVTARRQRIVFYYPDFGAQGGIERYIATVCAALKLHPAYEPVVVCSVGTAFYTQLKNSAIPVYGIHSAGMFARPMLRMADLATMAQLYVLMRRLKPDLVHVHIGQAENLVFTSLGIPVVYTFHGYGSLYNLAMTTGWKRLAKRMLQPVFRQVMRRMACTVFVSAAEQERMQRQHYLPTDAVSRVIPNGLPVADLAAQARAVDRTAWRALVGMVEEGPCIGFVNRLDVVKNSLLFLAWAESFWRQWPGDTPPQFVIAGDGPLAEAMTQRIARSPARDCFHQLGYCAEVVPVLVGCDLLVHIPQSEGFGLGVLEAMAVGTPVMAWPVGGIGALLADERLALCRLAQCSIQAMTVQATTLLNLPDIQVMALKNAMRETAQAFDVSNMMARLEAVYAHVLGIDRPLVSVLMPAYNAQATIGRAVRSIINQHYRHWELIVVDDGSCDDTAAIVETLADPRIRLRRQANQGVAVARNNAFALAQGHYIAFLDADDAWLPHKLQYDIDTVFAADTPRCMVYGGYYAVDEAGRLIKKSPLYAYSGHIADAAMRHEGLFLPSCALVHRDIMQAFGGFSSHSYHEDRVFFIRAALRFPAFPTGHRQVRYTQSENGRCRAVLKDFDAALAAEHAIVSALQEDLSTQQQAWLATLQTRNLLLRLLMYGQWIGARRLLHQVPPALLWQDTKGRLALLSFKLDINLLYAARRLMQILMRWGGVPRRRNKGSINNVYF